MTLIIIIMIIIISIITMIIIIILMTIIITNVIIMIKENIREGNKKIRMKDLINWVIEIETENRN